MVMIKRRVSAACGRAWRAADAFADLVEFALDDGALIDEINGFLEVKMRDAGPQ
jgi:hypothetical protein